MLRKKTLNICPYADTKAFYNIFILQPCAACLEKYFSQIDSLHFVVFSTELPDWKNIHRLTERFMPLGIWGRGGRYQQKTPSPPHPPLKPIEVMPIILRGISLSEGWAPDHCSYFNMHQGGLIGIKPPWSVHRKIFFDFFVGIHTRPVVLNLFLTADRSTLDNFTADHSGSAVKL